MKQREILFQLLKLNEKVLAFNGAKIYDLGILIKKEKSALTKKRTSKMEIVDSLITKDFQYFGKYHSSLNPLSINININAFWEFTQTDKQKRIYLLT